MLHLACEIYYLFYPNQIFQATIFRLSGILIYAINLKYTEYVVKQ